MKTPIEMMLDGVQWVERPNFCTDSIGSRTLPDGLPYATHEGVLEIAGNKLRCYRLNNGQTILDADDVHDFFGGELLPNA